jgi:hypothetical protein
MGGGTIVKISKVKLYIFSNIYESMMLLDDRHSNKELLTGL